MTDREIVIALAEKVMGWQIHECAKSETYEFPRELPLLVVFSEGGTALWRNNSQWRAANWKPLESIADAWMVVERLMKLGYYLYLETDCDGSAFAMFGEGTGDKDRSAPRAICLAALAAIGVPHP